jgi:hypothetical protein
MSDRLVAMVVSAAALAALAGAWAGTVVYVYWDTSRRGLTGWRQWGWVAVALFPAIGLLAYLLAKWLVPLGSATPDSPPQRNWRPTLLNPPAAGRRRPPTFAAADLIRRTVTKRPAVLPPARPPARAAEQFRMVAVDGPHLGQEFPLEQLPAQIGRSAAAAVCLAQDLGVSRQHAEIYTQGERLHIRDLQSAHGTRVNGQSITDGALALGDKIEVGHTLLEIIAGEARRP